jgi:hypothetical protein
MAQSRSIVGALFVVTLMLVAPSVFSGEYADKVSTLVGKVADCNKECEGKGTPADIKLCKEKCSIFEHFSYATIGVGACRDDCDKVKNDQVSFKKCEEKCREKYEARLSQIKQGQNP